MPTTANDIKKIVGQNNDTGTDGFIFNELGELSQKIAATQGMPEDLTNRLTQMLDRLNRMARLGHYASEFDTLSKYIDVVTAIPWSKRTTDLLDLERAKQMLDKNHFGMYDVKERILEYLATIILLKNRGEQSFAKSPVLLFVGLQGIGKTTLAISIAEALDRKFYRIAMGAIGSTLEIRGKSKSLPDAEPGQVVKALVRGQSMNPVLLFDEIEKASGDTGLRSDIMAVLLEILDPNQNVEFRDHYVDFPINLSECLFVCSANNTGTISAALMDRLEVIKLNSYTDAEKIAISRDFLFPKIIAKSGLTLEELQIDPNLWPNIVRPFGFDSGIRSLGRTLDSICRKVAKEIVEGKSVSVYINEQNLKNYLPK